MLLIARRAIAYLLIATAIMCRPIPAFGLGDKYDFFIKSYDKNEWQCNLSPGSDPGSDFTASTNRQLFTYTVLVWTKSIQLGNSSNNSVSDIRSDHLANTMNEILSYVVTNEVGIRLGATEDSVYCSGKEIILSPRRFCAPRYYCFMYIMLHDNALDYRSCLGRFNITGEQEDSSTWACYFDILPRIEISDCATWSWDLNKANWDQFRTDEQLKTALQGGVDDTGLYWKGSDGKPLAESFGRQFWNENIRCTLAQPCQHALDCYSVGSFTANPGLLVPYQSEWVYFATAAFVNINQQLRNQYDELKDAIESLALDTFSIDEFFPTKSQDFDLSNSLTGLSGIFSILGGFVPVAGPFISAAGDIASGVSTFLENSVAAAASDDPLAAQRIFSQKVLFFYRASLKAMDNLFSKLFVGDSIPVSGPGSFTLLDMMKGGGWVNPNTLTNVSSLNEKIRREILARSIDSLWKSRTEEQTIKMWVLFTDLSSDPNSIECAQSKSCHSQLIR